MADIPYLSGGESARAPLINAIWEEFDRKLQVIFHGKSFILGFNVGVNGIPADLMGRCFFFGNNGNPEVSRYAFRCPDAKVRSGSMGAAPYGSHDVRLWFYDSDFFANALQNKTEVVSVAGDIATVSTIIEGNYGFGLTKILNTSLFDHSLKAHTVQYPEGPEAQTYWVQETGVSHPERVYRYAVAEIILEGTTTLDLPVDWNKYNFFRIHNLNHEAATVTFEGDAYEVEIPALECRTVRRDGVGEGANYRAGFRYFWEFEGGTDYRHYWFFPTSFRSDISGNIMSHEQPTPANAMCANNLSNPALVYDWIAQLKFHQDFLTHTQRYAWFYQDPHVVKDVRSYYPELGPGASALPNGQPQAADRIGDWIHHRGRLIKVKIHKTQKFVWNGQQMPWPHVEVEDLEFRGFDTMVADFAAAGFAVTTNANGTLEIRAVFDANWELALIPIGTNLLKIGETYPTIFRFGATANQVRAIEVSIFEDQANAPTKSQRGGGIVSRRTITEVANTRTYFDKNQTGHVVVGPTSKTLVETFPTNAQQRVMWGVQTERVADLLSLNWFGHKDFASQDTAWTSYAEVRLVLTPFGLQLLFYEQIPAYLFAHVPTSDAGLYFFAPDKDWVLQEMEDGVPMFRRKRVIKLRGHGFGWPEEGRTRTMWWAPRYGRHVYALSKTYANEVSGPGGVDFSIGGLGETQSGLKVLQRLKHDPELMNGVRSGRFWRCHDQRTSGRVGAGVPRERGDAGDGDRIAVVPVAGGAGPVADARTRAGAAVVAGAFQRDGDGGEPVADRETDGLSGAAVPGESPGGAVFGGDYAAVAGRDNVLDGGRSGQLWGAGRAPGACGGVRFHVWGERRGNDAEAVCDVCRRGDPDFDGKRFAGLERFASRNGRDDSPGAEQGPGGDLADQRAAWRLV
jgi:hypothetical protein